MYQLQNRTLFFGDNLDILREKIPDETFDLIYLDPPFNSNRNYNVLFKEGLVDSPAQIQAFEDSWHWMRETESIIKELIVVKESKIKTNEQISNLMQALEKMIGPNDMMAYLTMMTIRLIELHRVLKNTGSIYLHCDPTASHYLKIVMDAIFGKQNFQNEIIWKRTNSPKTQTKSFGIQHDVILFYTKTDNFLFNKVYSLIDEEYSKSFIHDDNDGKGPYQTVAIVAGGVQKYEGRRSFEFRGVTAQWLYTKENLEKMFKDGLLYKTKTGGFRKKMYLKEIPGKPISDIWFDEEVKPLQGISKESLRYATQKPEALLDRIIKASSNENDWVLDPFCGCGTTVAVAERLKRNWAGIDITMLAINLIKRRLNDQFGDSGKLLSIFIDGIPKDLQSAEALAKKDRFEFEYWVLNLVNAMPAQSKTKENMRGADKGIDGTIIIVSDVSDGKEKYDKILVQVKSGGVQRNDIATLKGDIEREKAIGGLFITLEDPTKPMLEEAVLAGTFKVKYTPKEFPKIQIMTIKELLIGRHPDIPYWSKPYYKEAKKMEEYARNRQSTFGI